MHVNTFHFILPTSKEQFQWDQLAERSGAGVFSQSRYLNALIGEWMILYNADRTGGMICPFTIKLGQKILINPIYHQFSEWVGEGEINDEVIDFLKQEFPVSQLCIDAVIQPLSCDIVKWKHQVISRNEFEINSLAKRMLKKSASYEIRLNDEISLIYERIVSDLVGRIQGMTPQNVKSLKYLVEDFRNEGLLSFCAYDNGNFVGGIWVLENNNSMMYLKGSVTEAAKKEGVMYRLLHQAINHSLSKGKTFEFGGSNVENVRRFNLNLGGTDKDYTQLLWNSAPWWWNLVRSLRQKFRR
jgi:hypothetical protein